MLEMASIDILTNFILCNVNFILYIAKNINKRVVNTNLNTWEEIVMRNGNFPMLPWIKCLVFKFGTWNTQLPTIMERNWEVLLNLFEGIDYIPILETFEVTM